MSENNEKKVHFSDYLYILYKWKVLIITVLIIFTGFAVALAFLLPVTYRAVAVVSIPPESNLGLSGLTGLLGGGKSSQSLGAKLFGTSSSSEDMLLGLLNSRSALTNVINKYNLIDYYEIEDNNLDKTIKAFKNDILFEPNEFQFIEISVINKNAKKAAEMANYFVHLVDSLNIYVNVEAARNNRIFVEQRYNKNLADLKEAEDSLYKFQKKYGIFAVPEQLEISVKAAASLEAQLMEKEIESFLLKQQYGATSPQYMGMQTQMNLLKDKVNELKNNSSLSSSSNVLFPFKNVPDMMIKYLRFYRQLEIQSKILEVILPMYEQAKVEEQKSIPSLLFIDKAVPPQVKYEPKRVFIVAAISMVTLFLLIVFTFRAEYVSNLNVPNNQLVDGEKKVYLKFKKIFGIKN
ncbi:MAG TPA: Wzz/FepE/Etk N-terminal domain-containing protein [Melioribacteraceae bacterium]|nr:Wzz/FepE/Etk N-terminal domain-containing protein [Melioribacteraceae bacterium]